MFTLQRYIARELFKTFALTAFGLTLVFSLCGGVFNMIQVDVLTALQLWRILVHVVPVSVTLTLPVSALFSAAIVFGRLSADNEFNACRSSGINIHWLLAPAMSMAVLTAAFTFTFSNFIIPNIVEGLEEIVREDPQRAVTQTLRARGHGEFFGKYVIYADSFRDAIGDQPDTKLVELNGAAFIELEHGELARFGTTPQVLIQFETPSDGSEPRVVAHMSDVRAYDEKRKQFYELGDQALGPAVIPQRFTRKVKWLDLPELLHYRDQPWTLPRVEQRLQRLREHVQRLFFYHDLVAKLTGPDGIYRLGTPQRGYDITAAAAPVDRKSGRPRLDKPVVHQRWDKYRRTFSGESGTLAVEEGFTDDQPHIFITLDKNVVRRDDLAGVETALRSIELDSVPLPQAIVHRAAAIRTSDLLSDKDLGLSQEIDSARVSLTKGMWDERRRIDAEIHSRSAFSASVLVLVVLGAALGIICRGGQMLIAFVISFVPGLFVTIMIIMGCQLAEKDNTALIGLLVIWSGIGLVALADAVVVGRYLRR